MNAVRTDPDRARRGEQRGFGSWPYTWSSAWWLVVAYLALVGAGSIIGFAVLRRVSDSRFGVWETDVARWFEDLREQTWNTISDYGSALSDTITVVIVVVAVSVLFALVWRRWEEICLLVTALALEVSSFVTIGWIVGRDRPPVEQLDASPPTASFPSGHTAAAVALYFSLATIASWHTESRALRALAWSLAALASVAVAVSRVYRGMHYVSDVVAGAALGAACVIIAVALLRYARTHREGVRHA